MPDRGEANTLMDERAKEAELERLRGEVARLEAELGETAIASQWPPRGYYFTYHALAGAVLGLFGASTSLLANIVGTYLVRPPAPLEPHPLNLIRVYLTFPLGAGALDIDGGLALSIGCCLYLLTGMFLGVPFHLVQTWLPEDSTWTKRIAVATALAIALWLFNFYAILSWLQPLLFGGDWIVRMIPWWVAMLTHLVFGWTMVLVYPLGGFVPYKRFGEEE